MRSETIARLLIIGWESEYSVSISAQQRDVIIDMLTLTFQSIQNEERKGFRDMLEGAIETCKQRNLNESEGVLQALLDADQESEALASQSPTTPSAA